MRSQTSSIITKDRLDINRLARFNQESKRHVINEDDGFVFLEKTDNLSCSQFNSENELVDHITRHIRQFTRDVLQDNVLSYFREWELEDKQRVDMLIIGENDNYLVEVKNPASPAANRSAIGQLLGYGAATNDCQLVLVSTKFDMVTANTIEKYSLPIRYIFFSKEQSLEHLVTLQ